MKALKHIWRGFFFILLIAALCGGLTWSAVGVPARAAPPMQTASDIVISEFRSRGSGGGNDDFIELYNPTGAVVNLNGWTVNRSNDTGTITLHYSFTTAVLLQPGQHFLLANTGFDDPVAPDATYGSGITDAGGVALLRPDSSIADQAGLSSASAYKEGTPLTSLGGSNIDRSYERIYDPSFNCIDSNNNSTDFFLRNPSDPQNSSSPITNCGDPNPLLTATASAAGLTGTAAGLTSTAAANSTATASAVNATATAAALTSTAASNTPATGGGSIVISEFRTRGPNGASDEFIELYNPTGSAVSIGNWRINKSSGCGSTITTLATIPSSATLAPGQHYLIANSPSYSGLVTPDLSSTLDIADDGGIALLQSDGTTIVDQVGVCLATTYREGTALLIQLTTNTNRSYDRKSSSTGSCVDTNNNALDFILRSPSDPQNSSNALTACGNPTPVPTATRTLTPRPPPTRTRTATPLPPQPLVAINEFVPRPGHDWNLDGVINVEDEYIELINHGVVDVNLSGYSLDDEVNIGSPPYRLQAITLKPGERRVFYGKETGLLLSDGGDGVRLLKPNGQLVDAYNYFVVRFPDQSYCRLPDNGGADDWNQNCFPTPGLQNSLSGSTLNPPTTGGADGLCPIADTLPDDFVYAECLPFGNNIWSPAYWDRFGWYDERNLPESPGKWPVFVD